MKNIIALIKELFKRRDVEDFILVFREAGGGLAVILNHAGSPTKDRIMLTEAWEIVQMTRDMTREKKGWTGLDPKESPKEKAPEGSLELSTSDIEEVLG